MRRWPRWTALGVLAVIGVVLAAWGSDGRGVCDTSLGAFAQGTSEQTATACGVAELMFWVGVAVLVGVAIAALALVLSGRRSGPPAAAPGWYHVRPGEWAYFDGWKWGRTVRRPERPGP